MLRLHRGAFTAAASSPSLRCWLSTFDPNQMKPIPFEDPHYNSADERLIEVIPPKQFKRITSNKKRTKKEMKAIQEEKRPPKHMDQGLWPVFDLGLFADETQSSASDDEVKQLAYKDYEEEVLSKGGTKEQVQKDIENWELHAEVGNPYDLPRPKLRIHPDLPIKVPDVDLSFCDIFVKARPVKSMDLHKYPAWLWICDKKNPPISDQRLVPWSKFSRKDKKRFFKMNRTEAIKDDNLFKWGS